MNPGEYTSLDAIGLAALVRRREVSPVELLEAALARARAVNPQINAVIRYMEDEARGAIDRGLPPGPFTGVASGRAGGRRGSEKADEAVGRLGQREKGL